MAPPEDNGETPWIIINTATTEAFFECEGCKEKQVPTFPVDMKLFIGSIDDFVESHRECDPNRINVDVKVMAVPEINEISLTLEIGDEEEGDEEEEDDEEEEEESETCGNCNGSGEGMYDGSTCSSCKGLGEIRRPGPEPDWDAMADAKQEDAEFRGGQDEVDWESPI